VGFPVEPRHHLSMAQRWDEIEQQRGFIRVRLHLAATDEGGRRSPVLSDYRASWDIGATYEGEPVQNDAPLVLEDVDELPPGGVAVGRIHPVVPEYWSHVTPGMTIHAYEGPRRIGTATVLDVVPPTSA
jgi:hypothetical protein